MATTLASTAPRTNVYAAPAGRRKPRAQLPVVSSMDLPNAAGQKGPVPLKGIVNSMMLKRSR